MGALTKIKIQDRIALDTNIFIASFDPDHPFYHSSTVLLGQIKSTSPSVYISVMVIAEYLVKIYAQKLERNLSQYEDYLTIGGLATIVDVNRQICRRAAYLRSIYVSLRNPDAIHLASAIESKCKYFVTCDHRIPRQIDKLVVTSP